MKKEDIAKLFNISRQTLNNWEKEKPALYTIIQNHFDENKKEYPDLNIKNENVDNEIMNLLSKLPNNKKKKLYYLMMAELTELEE